MLSLAHLPPHLLLIGPLYWLKWALLCLLIACVAWLHAKEHRKAKVLLTPLADAPSRQAILSLLAARAMHLMLVLLVCILALIAYDIHQLQTRQPASIPAAMPMPTPAALPAILLPPASRSDLPFGAVSVFPEKDANEQAYLDLIKQRYEKLFVTYYFLSRCGVVSAEDFQIIWRALQEDLARIHAPAVVGNNILQASAGTYREIYARSSCDSNNIMIIKQAFEHELAPQTVSLKNGSLN